MNVPAIVRLCPHIWLISYFILINNVVMQILIRAFFPGTQIVSLGHRRGWTGSKGSSIFTALDTSSPMGFRKDSPHLTSGRCAGHDSLCYTLSKAGSDHKNTLPFGRGKNSISLFIVRGTLLCVRLSVLQLCARWAVRLGPSGLLGIGGLKGWEVCPPGAYT